MLFREVMAAWSKRYGAKHRTIYKIWLNKNKKTNSTTLQSANMYSKSALIKNTGFRLKKQPMYV
jgi:hypothetical protein